MPTGPGDPHPRSYPPHVLGQSHHTLSHGEVAGRTAFHALSASSPEKLAARQVCIRIANRSSSCEAVVRLVILPSDTFDLATNTHAIADSFSRATM